MEPPSPLFTLPPELQQNILFQASPAELINLCQTNSAYHNLCQNYGFWRQRFEQDRLPGYLLKPGELPLITYSRALRAQSRVRGVFVLAREDPDDIIVDVNLALLPSVQIIQANSVDSEMLNDFYQAAQDYARLRRDLDFARNFFQQRGGHRYISDIDRLESHLNDSNGPFLQLSLTDDPQRIDYTLFDYEGISTPQTVFSISLEEAERIIFDLDYAGVEFYP